MSLYLGEGGSHRLEEDRKQRVELQKKRVELQKIYGSKWQSFEVVPPVHKSAQRLGILLGPMYPGAFTKARDRVCEEDECYHKELRSIRKLGFLAMYYSVVSDNFWWLVLDMWHAILLDLWERAWEWLSVGPARTNWGRWDNLFAQLYRNEKAISRRDGLKDNKSASGSAAPTVATKTFYAVTVGCCAISIDPVEAADGKPASEESGIGDTKKAPGTLTIADTAGIGLTPRTATGAETALLDGVSSSTALRTEAAAAPMTAVVVDANSLNATSSGAPPNQTPASVAGTNGSGRDGCFKLSLCCSKRVLNFRTAQSEIVNDHVEGIHVLRCCRMRVAPSRAFAKQLMEEEARRERVKEHSEAVATRRKKLVAEMEAGAKNKIQQLKNAAAGSAGDFSVKVAMEVTVSSNEPQVSLAGPAEKKKGPPNLAAEVDPFAKAVGDVLSFFATLTWLLSVPLLVCYATILTALRLALDVVQVRLRHVPYWTLYQ